MEKAHERFQPHAQSNSHTEAVMKFQALQHPGIGAQLSTQLTVYICSNLWNVLIIGTPNFNYLICSNSWNEQIFETNTLSNCSNRQVLLSFIFSCYNVSRSY